MVCLCPCKFLASLRTSLQITGPDFNEHSYDDDDGEQANRIPKFLLYYIVVSKLLLLLLHKLHLLYTTTTKKIASIFAKFMTYMMT